MAGKPLLVIKSNNNGEDEAGVAPFGVPSRPSKARPSEAIFVVGFNKSSN
jgi:hypothetical protein